MLFKTFMPSVPALPASNPPTQELTSKPTKPSPKLPALGASCSTLQISFTFVAFPCLVLQYMGQTAYLIHHPETYSNAFWSAVPAPVFWPMFVIGTLAAIVASQVELDPLAI